VPFTEIRLYRADGDVEPTVRRDPGDRPVQARRLRDAPGATVSGTSSFGRCRATAWRGRLSGRTVVSRVRNAEFASGAHDIDYRLACHTIANPSMTALDVNADAIVDSVGRFAFSTSAIP
jgi:hypothetical protein